MMIDYGTFALYTPARPTIPARPQREVGEDMPTFDARMASWLSATAADRKLCDMLDAGVIFLKNEEDLDWYEIAHAGETGNTFAVLKNNRVVSVDTDPSKLFPIDGALIETSDPVQVGYTVVNGAASPYVPPLADAKVARVTAVWAACRLRVESGSIEVTTSAGTHTYGIDDVSQENIKSVLLGVALGVTPNPRPWTPRGELAPVNLTHADLTLVGATMMAAVDAHVQAYLAHKSAIMQLTTTAEVQAYDLTTGWPA